MSPSHRPTGAGHLVVADSPATRVAVRATRSLPDPSAAPSQANHREAPVVDLLLADVAGRGSFARESTEQRRPLLK